MLGGYAYETGEKHSGAINNYKFEKSSWGRLEI